MVYEYVLLDGEKKEEASGAFIVVEYYRYPCVDEESVRQAVLAALENKIMQTSKKWQK